MKKMLPTLLLLLVLSGCSQKETELPKTWTREFSIKLYTGGGMEDAAINIDFTYDSCVFETRQGRLVATISFAMTEAYRAEVLAKMKEVELDEIRTEKTDLVHDKETSQICYKGTKETCISSGASMEIDEDDRDDFSAAYLYLLDFAKTNK